MRTTRNWVHRYIYESTSLYVFVALLFLFGLFFGAMVVQALNLDQQNAISQMFGSYLFAMDQGGTTAGAGEAFQIALSANLQWFILLVICSLSVIGLPMVLAMNFVQGVLIGFTIGYLVAEHAWKGVIFSIGAVMPHHLLLVPAFLMLSVAGSSFALHVVRRRLLQAQGPLLAPCLGFLMMAGLMMVVTVIAAAVEAWVSPLFISWLLPMMLG